MSYLILYVQISGHVNINGYEIWVWPETFLDALEAAGRWWPAIKKFRDPAMFGALADGDSASHLDHLIQEVHSPRAWFPRNKWRAQSSKCDRMWPPTTNLLKIPADKIIHIMRKCHIESKTSTKSSLLSPFFRPQITYMTSSFQTFDLLRPARVLSAIVRIDSVMRCWRWAANRLRCRLQQIRVLRRLSTVCRKTAHPKQCQSDCLKSVKYCKVRYQTIFRPWSCTLHFRGPGIGGLNSPQRHCPQWELVSGQGRCDASVFSSLALWFETFDHTLETFKRMCTHNQRKGFPRSC